jgi:hypothetical protein
MLLNMPRKSKTNYNWFNPKSEANSVGAKEWAKGEAKIRQIKREANIATSILKK